MKNNSYYLAYPGKRDADSILQETRPAATKEVKTYGMQNLTLENWSNRLILGDNLPVMKTLLGDPMVRGCVSLVYIDPPFSKNQVFRIGDTRTSTVSSSIHDDEAYHDVRIGHDYLEFMRERLIFLRELLSDNGTIYVHIDWMKGHYIKVIMDEVFGEEHFLNDIARVKCNPKNFERRAFGNIKDIVLIYSKTDDYTWHEPREKMTEEAIRRLFPKVDEQGRRYTTNPLHAPGETLNGPTGRPWRGILPPKGRHWRYPPNKLEELDRKGLIEWSSKGNPRKIIYADERRPEKKMQDIWEFKDPAYPDYPTEKNLRMLELIVNTSSNKNGLVLDCFAGSGTTLVAAERLGRRWIGIDDSPRAIDMAVRRLTSLRKCRRFTLCRSDSQTLQEVLEQQRA